MALQPRFVSPPKHGSSNHLGANLVRKGKAITSKIATLGTEPMKIDCLSKKSKPLDSTSKARPFEIVEVIDDDEESAYQVKVTFFASLVNQFKGWLFGKKDKLDDVYHYFVGLDDEAKINKARTKEPDLVFQRNFQRAMDVSFSPFLCFFKLLIFGVTLLSFQCAMHFYTEIL